MQSRAAIDVQLTQLWTCIFWLRHSIAGTSARSPNRRVMIECNSSVCIDAREILAPPTPMIRHISEVLLAGFLSGFAFLGIGGRIAMRALAIAGDRPTNFGIGASAGIVLIGSVLGLLGGLLFALVGSRL